VHDCEKLFYSLLLLMLMLNNAKGKELQQQREERSSDQRESQLKSLSVKNFCTICANTHLQSGQSSLKSDFNENGTVIN
jgi:cytochrome c-type biogenesis protein CcmH/NrfF